MPPTHLQSAGAALHTLQAKGHPTRPWLPDTFFCAQMEHVAVVPPRRLRFAGFSSEWLTGGGRKGGKGF